MGRQTTGRSSAAEHALEITAEVSPEFAEILTPEALAFVAALQERFGERREALLQERQRVQQRISAGEMPDFPSDTSDVRAGDWQVAPPPADLRDRRVEITGPTDRKMMINALNSGASVFLADLEDANSPTWENVVQGQINLRDAVRRTISFTNPDGKQYALNDTIATLMVRPRGWHLPEKHVLYGGEPVSGSLFDFGLYLFHNAVALREHGTGPYVYLPKLESYGEARLWNDVFTFTEDELGLERGTIRATVLIETILAAFQLEEILYELRDHSAGLNCGRWDYIFSAIKKFRDNRDWVLPDRASVTMTAPMMRSYSLLTIATCHRRGAHAIGGMAAFIPVKNDEEANQRALSQVVQDKEREASDGHDGTWVAHPALVPVAREVFDRLMPEPNQVTRQRDDVHVTSADLLTVPEGSITEGGLRLNINVGLRYLASWLGGQGAAAINNLMEDAATAEISRAQVWQWTHAGAHLDDGRAVTRELVRTLMAEELAAIRQEIGEQRYAAGHFDEAATLFEQVALNDEWIEFLTLPGYELLR